MKRLIIFIFLLYGLVCNGQEKADSIKIKAQFYAHFGYSSFQQKGNLLSGFTAGFGFCRWDVCFVGLGVDVVTNGNFRINDTLPLASAVKNYFFYHVQLEVGQSLAKRFYITMPLKFSLGWSDYTFGTYINNSKNTFFIFAPGITIDMKVSNPLHLSLGYNYRFALGLEAISPAIGSNRDFSGNSIFLFARYVFKKK